MNPTTDPNALELERLAEEEREEYEEHVAAEQDAWRNSRIDAIVHNPDGTVRVFGEPPADYPVGVFPDEPAETYYVRRLDEASSSGMKVLDGKSPAHFKYWVENPDDDEESAALAFGKAFHCATLEPDVFDLTYAVLPEDAPQKPTAAMLAAYAKGTSGDSSKARIEWWQAWDADNVGRILLTAANYEKVRRMGESIRAHPVASGLILAGQRELTMRWVDEKTGVQCKARADLYDRDFGFLLDLKKTVSAHPEDFARSIIKYRYHVQHAHYADGARVLDLPLKHYVLLACEDVEPYVCAPYHIDAHAEMRGFEIRDRALERQAECLRTGKWPGYAERIRELTLPAYAFYD